jgi:hypothetical protein
MYHLDIRRKICKKTSNDAILRRSTHTGFIVFEPMLQWPIEPGGEGTNAQIKLCVNDIGTELQKIGKMLTDSAVEHSTVCGWALENITKLSSVLQLQMHALSTSEQALALQVLQHTQLTRNTTHTALLLALVNTNDHRESACLYMRWVGTQACGIAQVHAAGMPVCLSSLGIDVYGNTYVHECMRAPTHALSACSSSAQERLFRNTLSSAKETPRLAPVPRVRAKAGLQS